MLLKRASQQLLRVFSIDHISELQVSHIPRCAETEIPNRRGRIQSEPERLPAQDEKALNLKQNHPTLKVSQVRKGGSPPLKLEKLSRVIAITQE